MNIGISVIITMHNQKDYLEEFLKWFGNVKGIENIIFVDNGSDDGTAEILQLLGYDYILFDEGIQGYGRIWNTVIENFELAETVVFMEIRYLPGRNCFLRLADALRKNGAGAAGPVSNGFGYPQNLEIDSIEEISKYEDRCSQEIFLQTLGIDEGLWAISQKLLRENGKFHEGLINPKNVLLDYALRMIQKGYRLVVCNHAAAYDIQAGIPRENMESILGKCDSDILKDVWSMNYFNTIPDRNLLDLMEEDPRAELKVLEIGCDLGATLLEVRNRYPNSKVYGMEINEAEAEIAKHLAEVKVGNIEEENLPFTEEFDYIIFSDVLKHLHNPQRVIEHCKTKLKRNGCILASIPNVMHVSVMQELLNGRFPYQDTGMLDRDQIHFFTYHEVILMFQKAGYLVDNVESGYLKLTEKEEQLIHKLLQISTNVERFMYDSYQYLVKARKIAAEEGTNDEENTGDIKKLQGLVPGFAKASYQGMYLWKYLEYEFSTGVAEKYHNTDKDIVFNLGYNDEIPEVTEEQKKRVKELLDNLEKKDILISTLPVRREYNGKLEHTALDAYARLLDDNSYMVLEQDCGGQQDEIVYTKNRIRYDLFGVIGYYGHDEVDKEELTQFLVKNYIQPLERTFGTEISKRFLLRAVYMSAMVLKERKALLAFFDEILNKVQPKVILYTHGPDPMLCILNEAAHHRGIPTVEIAHGECIRTLVYPDTLKYSDYYLTHSDLITNPMLEKGFEDVYTIGKPEVYEHTDQDVRPAYPIVISIISSVEKDLFLKTVELAKRLNKQNYIVVYKMHPSELWSEEEMDRVMEENPNLQFLDGYSDVRNLYKISDIVIGVRSSGIIEALPYHKIKIILLKDNNEKGLLVGDLSFFQELVRLGDIEMADTVDQLYQEVMSYQRGESYRGVVNHFWPEDGKERFLKFMQIFLEGRRP